MKKKAKDHGVEWEGRKVRKKDDKVRNKGKQNLPGEPQVDRRTRQYKNHRSTNLKSVTEQIGILLHLLAKLENFS